MVLLRSKSISIKVLFGLASAAGLEKYECFIISPRSLQNIFCSSPGRFDPAGEARNCFFVIVIVSIKVLSIRPGPGSRARPGLGWKYFLLPRPGSARARLSPGSARARLARCVIDFFKCVIVFIVIVFYSSIIYPKYSTARGWAHSGCLLGPPFGKFLEGFSEAFRFPFWVPFWRPHGAENQ